MTTHTFCLRPRDAAKALGISPRTLWALTAPRGPIPCVRIGTGKRKSVLYPADALRAWLAQQTQTQQGG
jgi:predicted DNA-binding transcriptional regulator AlpA